MVPSRCAIYLQQERTGRIELHRGLVRHEFLFSRDYLRRFLAVVGKGFNYGATPVAATPRNPQLSVIQLLEQFR